MARYKSFNGMIKHPIMEPEKYEWPAEILNTGVCKLAMAWFNNSSGLHTYKPSLLSILCTNLLDISHPWSLRGHFGVPKPHITTTYINGWCVIKYNGN